MNRSWRRVLAGIAFAFCAISTARAQVYPDIVSGRVTTESGVPIKSANVNLYGLRFGAQTDSLGRYSFSVPNSLMVGRTVMMVCRLQGYRPSRAEVRLESPTIVQDFTPVANPKEPVANPPR
jgi:hypothetical protein